MDSITDEQRGVFRYDVAGVIKSLIRHRHHCNPQWLSDTRKRQWDVPDVDEEYNLAYEYVLNWAWRRYRFIYSQYREFADSTTDMREVWNLLLHFFRHGPKGWGKAIKQLPAMEDLVDWRWLDDVREALDNLPHPTKYPPDKQTPEEYWASCGYEGWALCPHCKTPMRDDADPERTLLGEPKQITVDNFELANSTPIGHGRVKRGEVICNSCAGEILIDLRNHNGLSDTEATSRMGW